MAKSIWQRIQILMGIDDKYAHLKYFYIFQDLTTLELKLIDNIVNLREFQESEMLYEEGYPLESLYLIIDGKVEVSGSAKEAGTTILGSGGLIGLIDLFNGGVRNSSAKALGKTKAYAISKTDLNHLIDTNPRLGVKLLRAIASYLSAWISKRSQTGNELD